MASLFNAEALAKPEEVVETNVSMWGPAHHQVDDYQSVYQSAIDADEDRKAAEEALKESKEILEEMKGRMDTTSGELSQTVNNMVALKGEVEVSKNSAASSAKAAKVSEENAGKHEVTTKGYLDKAEIAQKATEDTRTFFIDAFNNATQSMQEIMEATSKIKNDAETQLIAQGSELYTRVDGLSTTAIAEIELKKTKAVEEVTEKKTEFLSEMETKKNEGVAAVDASKANILTEFENKRATAVASIDTEEADALSKISTEKTKALSEVTNSINDLGTKQSAAISELETKGSDFVTQVTALKDRAVTAETNAVTSAANLANAETTAVAAATTAQEWAETKPNQSAKYWAQQAKTSASEVIRSGGIWQPSVGNEYPDVSSTSADTLWMLQLPTNLSTYTFTTGQLSGTIVSTADLIFYKMPEKEWSYLDTNVQGIVSVNGKTDKEITITKEDVGLGKLSIDSTSDVFKFTNSNGWGSFGPESSSYCHFKTNVGRFYMGSPLYVEGDIACYNHQNTRFQGSTGYIYEKGKRVYSENNKPTVDEINPLRTYSRNLTLQSDVWADMLLSSDFPATGVYQILVSYTSEGKGGSAKNQNYTGSFYMRKEATAEDSVSEIMLQHMGEETGGEILYLRTKTNPSSNGGLGSLQISCDSTFTAPVTFDIKLRRIM